ncbi:unnamed protein product [Gongylonema pulchrum]|uniref:Uncharacterized protein n=1 Tax=Gongylonema pulchrum TaxID=637853 RepID=A0A183D3V9_9BILA|nr:unnamed protein product [Gongylonema pulchrum]
MSNKELDLAEHTNAMDVSLALDPIKLQNDSEQKYFDLKAQQQQQQQDQQQQEVHQGTNFGETTLKILLSKTYRDLLWIFGGQEKPETKQIRER